MAAPDARLDTAHRRLSGWRLWLVLVLGVVFVAGPPFFSTYWVGLLTQMVILAILAMSLDLLLGYTGLPSLGHAAFFGVAAYAVAVLATGYGGGFWLCFLGGIAVGTLLAAAFGTIVSHVRDVYFLMITLALGMVLWGLSYRWIPVTGGDNGISGIPSLEAHAGLWQEVDVGHPNEGDPVPPIGAHRAAALPADPGRGLAAGQVAHEDAVLDERYGLCGDALIVPAKRAHATWR